MNITKKPAISVQRMFVAVASSEREGSIERLL
jgi:hypothetical protein